MNLEGDITPVEDHAESLDHGTRPNSLSEIFLQTNTAIENADWNGTRRLIHALFAFPGREALRYQALSLRKLCLLNLMEHGSVGKLPSWVSSTAPKIDKLWDTLTSKKPSVMNETSSISHEHAMFRISKDAVADVTDLSELLQLCQSKDLLVRDDIQEPLSVSEVIHRNLGKRLHGIAAWQLKNEDALREKKEWPLATQLSTGSRQYALDQLSRIYSALSITETVRVLHCDNEESLRQVIDAYNSTGRDTSCSIQSDRPGYVIFEPRKSGENLDDLVRKLHEIELRICTTRLSAEV